MEFNEELQELRKSRSLTQEKLAEELFVSRTAISARGSGFSSRISISRSRHCARITSLPFLLQVTTSKRVRLSSGAFMNP